MGKNFSNPLLLKKDKERLEVIGGVWLKTKLAENLYNISVSISIVLIENHFLDAK